LDERYVRGGAGCSEKSAAFNVIDCFGTLGERTAGRHAARKGIARP